MGIRRDGRATRSRGRQRLSASVQGAAGDGADTASQVTDSPCRFNAISYWDRQAFLAIGYVVLDTSTMPIVGEGDAEPNDTDVPQLIADAQAAVDEVVRRGVTDRAHIAIGGHSYGAFMTANLLAYTRLFKPASRAAECRRSRAGCCAGQALIVVASNALRTQLGSSHRTWERTRARSGFIGEAPSRPGALLAHCVPVRCGGFHWHANGRGAWCKMVRFETVLCVATL